MPSGSSWPKQHAARPHLPHEPCPLALAGHIASRSRRGVTQGGDMSSRMHQVMDVYVPSLLPPSHPATHIATLHGSG